MKVQVMDNGQIAIPAEIQRQLGLREGDELLFYVEGNEVRLRPFKRRRLSGFCGALSATVPYPGKEAIRQQVAQAVGQAKWHTLKPVTGPIL